MQFCPLLILFLMILLIIFRKIILKKLIFKIKQMLWHRLFHTPPIHNAKIIENLAPPAPAIHKWNIQIFILLATQIERQNPSQRDSNSIENPAAFHLPSLSTRDGTSIKRTSEGLLGSIDSPFSFTAVGGKRLHVRLGLLSSEHEELQVENEVSSCMSVRFL